MATNSLLPRNHEQFNQKEYWDEFFIKTKKEAFEWYGGYNDIKSYFYNNKIPKNVKILIIGCGNSNLSNEMYDDGYTNITNIDFSQLVIDEMKQKNLNIRTNMKWLVMDMTSMIEFSNNSFDIILDKGALDALMSVDSIDIQIKAMKMFNEISRILTSCGSYLCISLCESYILKAVLSYFQHDTEACTDANNNSWRIDVNAYVESEKIIHTKLIPYLLNIRRCISSNATLGDTIAAADKPGIYMNIDMFYNQLNKPLLIENKVLKDSKPISSEKDISNLDIDIDGIDLNDASDVISSCDVLLKKIDEMQKYHFQILSMGQIKIGRYEVIDFHVSDEMKTKTFQEKIPRFSIYVLDYTVHAVRDCAVFIIPAGRESEFQFSTQEGLSEIAQSAQCKRLLAVRRNKPHVFNKNMQILQNELNPLITSLIPKVVRDGHNCLGPEELEPVPYMALEDDVSWHTIGSGTSEQSGKYIVEEKIEPTIKGTKERRLVFLINQNFIQTEVTLLPIKSSASGTSSKKKGAKKNKGKTPVASGVDTEATVDNNTQYKVDVTKIDAHYCAVLIACAFQQTQWNIDNGATTKGSSKKLKNKLNEPLNLDLVTKKLNVLVLGLGGGALPSTLITYLPNADIYGVEWDPTVIQLALDYFGYCDSSRLSNSRCHSLCMDGLDALDTLNEMVCSGHHIGDCTDTSTDVKSNPNTVILSKLNELVKNSKSHTTNTSNPIRRGIFEILFVDIDGKANDDGIAAPPLSFITKDALVKYRNILTNDGCLVMNIVCRNEGKLNQLLNLLCETYKYTDGNDGEASDRTTANIYLLTPSDENVNVVVFVNFKPCDVSALSPIQSTTPKYTKITNEYRLNVVRNLNKWLQALNPSQDNLDQDPLDLLNMVSPSFCNKNIHEIV